MDDELSYTCQFCGSKLIILYKSLIDCVFSSPGKWDYYQCSNNNCKTVSIRPLLKEEEIKGFYETYYTHVSPQRSLSVFKKIYLLFKYSYIEMKFGYPLKSVPFLWLFLFLFPIKRAALDYEVVSVKYRKNGKILDIGCGDGHSVSFFKSLGWEAYGIDFDPHCESMGQHLNVPIRCAEIGQHVYGKSFFDAITMIHLIEHIRDPLSLLVECKKALACNGKIYLLTPNIEGFGHELFKHHWRGLEPPRHLNIFSKQSIRTLLKEAGFTNIVTKNVIAPQLINASLAIQYGLTLKYGDFKLPPITRIYSKILAYVESFRMLINNRDGDVILAIAEKQIDHTTNSN